MADENGDTQSAQIWPVPEFHFSVEISNVGMISCKEIFGIDLEFDVIEYRSGDMPGFTKVKMPGLRKSGDVTLMKAMFKDDKKLRDWINQVKMNIIQRESATIALLDEAGTEMASDQRMAEKAHRGKLQGRRKRCLHGNDRVGT